MDNRILLAIAFTTVIVAAACSDRGSTTPDPGRATEPSVKAILGANQKDTIQAQLAQALVIEVRRAGGKPLVGTIVRFEVLPPTDPTHITESAAYICNTPLPICDEHSLNSGQLVTDTSDTEGHASAFVRLGTVASTARIVASVPVLGLADTASFTVLPGMVTRISLLVRDSAVYVGGSYRFGPVAHDRIGNVVEITASPTLIGTGVTIENGDTFRGTSIGRAGAVVHAGLLSDTAWVTVPPRGTLAVFDAGQPGGVAKVELDGSGYRLVGQTEDTYYGTFPSWTSTGNLLFESGHVYEERMYVADTLGNRQRVTSQTTATRGEIFSDGSLDGWIYFSASGSPLDYGTGIWRLKSPGTDPVRVGPNPAGSANAWKVSASPDGRQLAYSDVDRGGVTLIDVATGAPHAIVPQADMPRWSPIGDWIVFNADTTLYRIRPDGSGKMRVGPIRFYHPGADWSPDGEWIIARSRSRLELINVSAGTTLPLGWSSRFIRPAWKP